MRFTLLNRQRRVPLNAHWLRKAAAVALPLCLEESDDEQFALRALPEVTVAIISDRAMARLHVEFMQIEGPTDVLTFEHGEIAISAETAAVYARQFRRAVEMEITLYTVHGLLHLNGFDDRSPAAAARMRRTQNRVLRRVCSALPPP